MTSAEEKLALELFDQLLEVDPRGHSAFLASNCPDATVRQRVVELLRADAREQGLLDDDAQAHFVKLTAADIAPVKDPDAIGHYKIIERLGEGGMAVVYRAERIGDDFEQTVALKLISQSRHTEHWQQRFFQERQILASLQHPNIAALLDGGISDEGRPYFAMEYVAGLPITDYCDQQRLGLRERLRLLLSVCDSVSYAHSNLVVHRDLKPSNILVDENRNPKLLDFGIAKILTEDNTDQTQTTLRALTPDYAAPEQFVGGTVTTAVDVYALGALLFELLSGSRPFERVSGSALDIEREVLGRGAPSFAKLEASTTSSIRDAVATNRRSSWKRLQRALKGDLENIAQKALRIEAERRYASVEAFANDLRRYLDGLPVLARKPTLRYRLKKFAARHPIGVPLGAFATGALIGISMLAVQQARKAENAAEFAQLEAARANETRDFVTSLFEFAGPDKSLGDQLTARQLLDLGAARVEQELSGQPEVRGEMQLLLANTYGQLGSYTDALPLAQQAADIFADVQNTQRQRNALLTLARLHRYAGNYDESANFLEASEVLLDGTDSAGLSALLIERGELAREQAEFDTAREAFERALSTDREQNAPAESIARDLYRLGTLEFSAGDNELGLDLLRQAAQHLDDYGTGVTTQYASIQHDIGVMLIQRGELAEAKIVLEATRESRQQLLSDQHPDLAVTLKELAGIARQLGDSDVAEDLYLQALSINESMLGSEHPETANNLNSLAVFYRGLGRDQQALEFGTRALAGAQKVYGDQHPTVGLMTINVGAMQRMVGRLDEALATTESGLDILLGALGENHHLAGVAFNALAGVQYDQRDLFNAETNYRKALKIFEATAGENHPHVVNIRIGLGMLLVETLQLEEAQAIFDRALEIANNVLPPEHPTTAVVHVALARIAALKGRCEEANQRWQEYGPRAEAVAATARISRSAAEDIQKTCD